MDANTIRDRLQGSKGAFHCSVSRKKKTPYFRDYLLSKGLGYSKSDLSDLFRVLSLEISLCSEAVLRSYAIIFFSQSALFGAVLMAATLTAPQFGLIGFVGLCIAYGAARLLGFDLARLQNGLYLFNSLLVSLTLAYLESWQALSGTALCMLLVLASVGTLLVSVALSDLCFRYLALPSLSLPFVVTGFLLFYLFHALSHIALISPEPVCLLPAVENLPPVIAGFLQALGAIFFLPHTTIGLIVLACLLIWSRLAVLYAVSGWLSGFLLLQALGLDIRPEAVVMSGFNFVFTGIALGGIFLVPSRASLLLAILASCFCALTAQAAGTALARLGIPPLALPLNLVVLSLLYALKCRPRIKHLMETPFEPGRPENNFRRFAVERARFPDPSLPQLYAPFFGERTVSQSFNGAATHRSKWREALDFEIVDEQGNKFAHLPLDLKGSFLFGTPVLAPCGGTVVRVVNDVPDNAVGEIHTDRNWGNLMIIRSDAGWYVKLCHLQQGSVELAEGARVAAGQVIGRCGNSGRSPVPHLHMQVQHSDLIGGHTVPFRLTRYFSSSGRYHASGVPELNETVFSARFDPALAACFECGESSRNYHFNGRSEILHTSFNAQGERIFSSGKASLTACIKDQTFYMLDYKGGVDNALIHLYLGLAAVPLVDGEKMSWTEQVDLRPLLRPWAVTLLELANSFIEYPMGEVDYRLIRNNDGTLRILSSIKYPIPRSLLRQGCPEAIEVSLSPDGIERIDSHQSG